jgi:predicted nucleic acid-binding protein
MAKLILDTTVLIDHLKGRGPARNWLLGLTEPPLVSEVSRAEVIRGLRSGERGEAEQLFTRIVWVPVVEPISRLAGELGRQYRRSHAAIGVADLLVAATATHLGATVATRNVRHFPMFKGLSPPY